MSDRDTSNPTPPGQGASSGAQQNDDFDARTVMLNQDVLGAARAEAESLGAQQPDPGGAGHPGQQWQSGAHSWRPEQPAAPAGPPPEAQTRAYPADAGASAGVGSPQPPSPFSAGGQAQGGGAATTPFPTTQPGQPAAALAAGSPGAHTAPQVTQYQHPSHPSHPSHPAAEEAWRASAPGAQAAQAPGGTAPAGPGVPSASSAPGSQPAWGRQDPAPAASPSPFSVPSAPAAPSTPVASSAPGTAQGYAAPGAGHDGHPAAAPHPAHAAHGAPAAQEAPGQAAQGQWGHRSEGEVGMSSVFPVAVARAEADHPAPQAGAASQAGAGSQASSQWDAVATGPSAPQAAPVVPAAFTGAPEGSRPGASAEALGGFGDEDSLGSWLLAIFLTMIPVVGLIYLIVVSFTGTRSTARRNWARATLVWMVIATVLTIVAGVSLWGALLAAVGS